MADLSNEIEKLKDEKVIKATLWFVDELEEQGNKRDLNQIKRVDSKSLAELFANEVNKSLHKEVIPPDLSSYIQDSDYLKLMARRFLKVASEDSKYSMDVQNIISEVQEERGINDIITLLSALNSKLVVGIILFLAIRFEFEVIFEREKMKVKFLIGKEDLLSSLLKKIF